MSEEERKMEKRKHPRMGMDNLTVDVTDGVGVYKGMVSDISRFGVCLTELQKTLNGNVKNMTILVSSRGKHYKMMIQPKWYTDGGGTKSLGAEILNVPPGWEEFVTGFEPEVHEDVRPETHL